MGETELHGLELVGVLKGGDETLALESNASHHFVSLVTSLDNLLKGASGQAIQNMNLMYGLDEGMGLL